MPVSTPATFDSAYDSPISELYEVIYEPNPTNPYNAGQPVQKWYATNGRAAFDASYNEVTNAFNPAPFYWVPQYVGAANVPPVGTRSAIPEVAIPCRALLPDEHIVLKTNPFSNDPNAWVRSVSAFNAAAAAAGTPVPASATTLDSLKAELDQVLGDIAAIKSKVDA